MRRIVQFLWGFLLIFPITVNALTKDDMQTVSLEKLGSVTKLNDYQGFQGMTITNNYIIVSISKEDNTAALVAIDKSTYEVVKTVENLNYGHANDLAYNSDTNEILVINGTSIYVLDGDTLDQKEIKTLDTSASAIDVDSSGYYTLAGKTVKIYDNSLSLQNSFNVETNLITQGISYYNGYIFLTCYESGVVGEYEPVYDGILEAGANVIYVYNLDGTLKNVFYIPTGYGEIESITFQDGKYYLLFNSTTSTEGVFYTLDIDDLVMDLTVDVDETYENLIANVFAGEQVITNGNIENNKYVFPLTFSDTGTYQYTVKQNSDDKNLSFDNESIPVVITVSYDVVTNSLNAKVTFTNDKQAFSNVKEQSSYVCEEVDGHFYGENGEELNGEEFMNTCGVVANPQTGAFLPIALFIGAGFLSLAIIFWRKKQFYRL